MSVTCQRSSRVTVGFQRIFPLALPLNKGRAARTAAALGLHTHVARSTPAAFNATEHKYTYELLGDGHALQVRVWIGGFSK